MQQPVVVKIGSSSLTSAEGGLNRDRIEYFVDETVRLTSAGYPSLIVTSGAVAAGFRRIGFASRPRAVHEKQAAAAVGQALLMQAYNEAFARHGKVVAQLLLTRSDFSDRKRIHNALMTMEELLRRNIIPIINENDTVAVDELKFGDNDTLSALVANLVKARHLLIVTDTDGLYTADPRKDEFAVRIDRVERIDASIYRLAGGAGTAVGTGGMRSKVEAARIATRGGVPVFVGKAAEPGDLLKAVRGDGNGTYFETSLQTLSMKKQWVGFHSRPAGTIYVDEGAAKALTDGHKSLLPAGVQSVDGDFHPGDVVEVAGPGRTPLGRGVVNYTAWQLQAAAGLTLDEVRRRIDGQLAEVIHRDEWVAYSG